MEIKTVLTCPLGAKCEEIKDGAIHRCAWYTKLAGTNPNTGETVDEHGCAMSWLPMLMIENSMQQRSTSAAVESFRNETVQANQTTQQIMLAQRDPRLL
tara:strand:- start:538 stop:834 length:297 start_codon:yes stop_codon:yes gene_type:complete